MNNKLINYLIFCQITNKSSNKYLLEIFGLLEKERKKKIYIYTMKEKVERERESNWLEERDWQSVSQICVIVTWRLATDSHSSSFYFQHQSFRPIFLLKFPFCPSLTFIFYYSAYVMTF